MDAQDHQNEPLREQRWVKPFSITLLLVGTLSRLAPFTDPNGRMLRQFMTEDGYLMQTIARNFALGHGLSVSDGTIATNGTQPLPAFIFAFFHYLANGNKIGGIAGIAAFSVLVSLASAGLLYSLMKNLLRGQPDGQPLALLIASLWFVSPTIVKHSMNGLETGLYFLTSLAMLTLFIRFIDENSSRLSWKQMILMGLMFGLCFLTRNDAAFLIAATLLARLILQWPRNAGLWWDRIIEAVVPGLISVAIALPWLIYNYRLFGSIEPISGIAEALGAHLGGNLIYLPAVLLDFITILFPIPPTFETNPLTILAFFVVLGAALPLSRKILLSQPRHSTKVALLTYGIFGILLCSFYGVYFGVPFFMSRYLSILSPILAAVGVTATYRLLTSTGNVRRVVQAPMMAVALVVAVGLNVRIYRNGLGTYGNFPAVDWVLANVPPQTWVGAIQTGTLGFFHDRTINLDGKVNPEALRARLTEGGVISYILRTKIQYLADWEGLATWSHSERDGFNQKFKLIVDDKKANLAVFERFNP
jgi:hypothetical protein